MNIYVAYDNISFDVRFVRSLQLLCQRIPTSIDYTLYPCQIYNFKDLKCDFPDSFYEEDYLFLPASSNLGEELLKFKVLPKRIYFYDCDDNPDFFKFGTTYNYLKDRAVGFIKMVLDPTICYSKFLGERLGHRLFTFPVKEAIQAVLHAKTFSFRKKKKSQIPFFLGTPTWIEKPDDLHTLTLNPEFSYLPCIGPNKDGVLMYNQRLHWLSLLNLARSTHSGVYNVFGNNSCYALLNVSQMFGSDASYFYTHMRLGQEYRNLLLQSKIALNPAGHDRFCFRMYDIMTHGNILVSTDMSKREAFLMPRSIIQVKDDGSDLLDIIENCNTKSNELLAQARTNQIYLDSFNRPKHSLVNKFFTSISVDL